MDAFYASVEARDDPELAGIPLIVGGDGRRGVVASCSYEARAFGVRSAMSSAQARRLCPQAIFVAGRYHRYAEVSREMHSVFARFTPLVEGISVDEAFLDITGAVRLFGPPATIGAEIRRMVREEMGLGCSVGGATVKFMAKLASEAAKPKVGNGGPGGGAGVVIVPDGAELAFLHPLPVEALWGVGPATAKRLRGLGLATIGDMARVPPAALEQALGRAAGRHLADLARGIDERRVVPQHDPKSVSHEETYPTDRWDRAGLDVEILRMADSVATRLRKAGLIGRTVTLKVRYGDFTTITRSSSIDEPTAEAGVIARVAATLLAGCEIAPGVRLLGVGLSNLSPSVAAGTEQLSLLDTALVEGNETSAQRHDARTATAAVDAIRARFGPDSVGPASLLGADGSGLRIKKQGDQQWGPGGAPIRRR
jgi:DNA polymerase-4